MKKYSHPESFLPRQLNQGDDVKCRTNFCYHGEATGHKVSGVKFILPTETYKLREKSLNLANHPTNQSFNHFDQETICL